MKKPAQPHHVHATRVVLFGVLLIAVGLVRVNAHALPSSTKQAVLAYAVSMSRSELFAEANASRTVNGLAPFSLNGALNNSAQAKAQHMADNNYWAHVAPDGTQPWYFFTAAGYNYSKAGENLAYGFSNSYTTNQGWMNSPSHRANILGDYVEVGFGIVNAPSFQGGENTIVVAHYGTQIGYSAPAPAPEPAPAPSPAPVSNPTPATSSEPTPVNDTTPAAPETPDPVVQPPTEQQEATKDATADQTAPTAPVAVGVAKSVSVFESIRTGAVPGVAALSLTLTVLTAFGYALSHRALMKHALATGEHFVVAHPTFDAFALALALALILSTTAARLQ